MATRYVPIVAGDAGAEDAIRDYAVPDGPVFLADKLVDAFIKDELLVRWAVK